MISCPLRREPVLQALGAMSRPRNGRVHVAVMREPWLTQVLQGRKTVESRFSTLPIPPHGVVKPGDLLLFKRASGPVCATSEVSAVEFHDLRQSSTEALRARHGKALCADDEFWAERADARYATFMYLADVREVPEFHLDKRDRRGWVVLAQGPHIHADQLQLAGLAAAYTPPARLLVVVPPSTVSNPAQLTLPGCGHLT